MNFLNPFYILLFLFLPFIVLRRMILKKSSMRFGSTAGLSKLPTTLKVYVSRYLWILRGAALVLIVFGLMRPQSPVEGTKIQSEGVDIVLAVDASGSMAAEDFVFNGQRHDRLTAVKHVIEKFINARNSDRLGLLAFAGRAYIVCPLTLDYAWLIDNLQRVELGVIEEDGTAVGSAIATAVSRLKKSKAKSKIIILLTDGRNNAGSIEPAKAAAAAKAMGIKIYTIGAGKKGLAPFPAQDFFGNKVYRQVQMDLDEKTLKEIAETTGGVYFRATDMSSLKKVYSEIDKMETTSIQEQGYSEYKELFLYFIIPAFFLLILEILLVNTFLKRII